MPGFDAIKQVYAQRINDRADLTALYASQNFAPYKTGQLRDSIQVFQRATPENLVAYLTASAKSAGGVEYAGIQNSAELRHASNPPNVAFQDLADPVKRRKQVYKTGPRERAYQRGYRKAIATGKFKKYAARFFLKGYEQAAREIK